MLIVSDLYPPYYLGGYELRCAQVAEALSGAGHAIRVLTSTYGLEGNPLRRSRRSTETIVGVRIDRRLNDYAYDPQPLRRPWRLLQATRELWDARQFLTCLRDFQPDVVNWWSMCGLSRTLLPIPGALGIPDLHWIEHPWMIAGYGPDGRKPATFWDALWDGNWGPSICRPLLRVFGRAWERRVAREGIPTRRFPNRPRHVCFVSEYLRTLYREEGLAFPSSEIIYGGVPTQQFYRPVRSPSDVKAPLRVLYAGQVSPDRSPHTVVEAIGQMAPDLRARLRLSVAGDGPSSYFSHLKVRIEELGLGECISFLGKVPHDQMPRVYAAHGVLVFPSTRAEGLPLTMVEAMLAGCAVVTTGSGGAMEIATLADLPLFAKDDAPALCRLLTRLVSDRTEVVRIASRGQEVALREFTFERMMDRFSETLQRLQAARTGCEATDEVLAH